MLVVSLSLVLSIIGSSKGQRECFYDGNEFCIDQNDILSADLLPGTFLLAETTKSDNDRSNDNDNSTIDGSIDKALGEMEFHRKRMNEYLCHGFMAEEIFREMKTIRVKRRPDDEGSNFANSLPDFLGDPVITDNDNGIDTSDVENVTIHDKLLSDEGSVKYKDWLQRTTTLDDVYRHYVPQKKLKKKIGNRHPPRQSHVIDDHGVDGFDGDVTGYALPAHVTPDKVGSYYYDDPMISSPMGHVYHQYGGPEHQHHSHDVAPIIHEEHHYGHSSHHHDDEDYHHRPSHHKGKGHELTTKDFFEIALTALAFLAFGLFVIQLLMNITNSMAAIATTPAAADLDPTRFRRNVYSSAKPIYQTSTEEFDILSHRILRSIEAAMVVEQDSGRCLRWSLCNDNNFSRNVKGPQRIWLPIWSLGMSWVSGRMLNRRSWPVMLESVKASILGLGGVDCSSIYPDCDLARERIKRRRRRRRK